MQATYLNPAPRGAVFVKSLILQHHGLTGENAEAFAARRWGKAAVSGLVTDDTLADGNTAAEEFFAAVRAASIAGRLPLRRVAFGVRMITAGPGATGYWVGEAAPRPLSRPVLTGSVLRALSVNALICMTDDALKVAGPATETALRADLVKALSQALDEFFINPSNSGSPDVYPAAVNSGTTPLVSSNDPGADLNALFAAYQGDWRFAFLITDPTTAVQLALVRDNGGGYPLQDCGPNGGSLLNVPLLTSNASPRNSAGGIVTLLDASAIAVAFGSIELAKSGVTTLAMQDDPSSPIEQVSMFQTNSVVFRATMQANWELQHAAAISVLVDVNYGAS